ncbi:carbohydrate kinase family protein [Candidatus Saccharibacteria bacterium]|nr:MAG: carbohydrate kinase family protein [Candidatus Saccharibacteria bacterium]
MMTDILIVMTSRPIVLTGSIAIDRIMSFSGSYEDYLHAEKLDSVSVSIFLDSLRDTSGGVAANIAYTLALLGNEPYLLGSVGPDAVEYMEKLARHGVNIAHIHESMLPTATFNVITDSDQNQVGGFYPGAMFDSDSLSLEPWREQNPLVVISPHDPKAMSRQIEEAGEMSLSVCYDIGQQVSNAPAEDIRAGIEAAEILIMNDYEFAVLCKRTGLEAHEITAQVPVVITTHGPDGSRVEGTAVEEPIEVGVATPSDVVDPTGAGDAYRAGLCYGYAHGWSLRESAQLGATCASFAIETLGTQTHMFDHETLTERYENTFGSPPPFNIVKERV